jgi:uncharacterized membrane protein
LEPAGKCKRFLTDCEYQIQSRSLSDFPEQDAGHREQCPWPAGLRKHTAARERSGVIRCDRRAREAHGVILFRGAETHTRSVLKAISWRTLGTLDTFAISWFMTGRIEVAGSIAGLEIITKIAWYYLHERLWASVTWGRR